MSEAAYWVAGFENSDEWRKSEINDGELRYVPESPDAKDREALLSDEGLELVFGDHEADEIYGDRRSKVLRDIGEEYSENILTEDDLEGRGVTVDFPMPAEYGEIEQTVDAIANIFPPNMVKRVEDGEWMTINEIKRELEESYVS
jgi:hypothetical protein